MAGQTHRTKVGGIWVFQYAIPGDVRDALAARHPEYSGQKVIRRSLKTGDSREAERRARPLIDLWRARVEAARGRADTASDDVTEAVAKLRALGYLIAAPGDDMADWERDDEGRLIEPTPPTMASVAAFAKDAAKIESRAAAAAVDRSADLLRRAGVPPAAVAVAAQAAGADRSARATEAGKVVARLTGGPTPVDDRPTISSAVARWKEERAPSRSAAYDADFALRIFIELFGDLPLNDIKRAHMAELLDTLKKYPTRLAAEGKRLPVKTLIEKHADSPRPAPITAIKKWRLIDAAMGVAVHLGQLEANPADGIKPNIENQKKAKVKTRLPFSDEQLKAIWDKLTTEDEESRWIHVLGLVTGARLNEIVQLRAADMIERDGVICINIDIETDEHGEKRIKNKSSIRTVPLLSEIAAAFKAFARSRAGLLFPDWQSGDGTSNVASKRVMRLIRSAVADDRVVFHSYRHFFEDACRAAAVPKDVRSALTGHADSDVSASYGNGFPVAVLAEAVERLAFPVDLRSCLF